MSGLNHLIHSCILVSIAYVIMIYGLKQSPSIAEPRSLAIGASAFGYMLIFGHDLPPFLKR